jgi:hypothetical protein
MAFGFVLFRLNVSPIYRLIREVGADVFSHRKDADSACRAWGTFDDDHFVAKNWVWDEV